MDIRDGVVVNSAAVNTRLVTAALLPVVGVVALLTSMDVQPDWLRLSPDIDLGPGIVLDAVAVVLAVFAIQILRAACRATFDQDWLRYASVVFVAGVTVVLAGAGSASENWWLHWGHLTGGLTIGVLAMVTFVGRLKPKRFAVHLVLSTAIFAACGLSIAILLGNTGLMVHDPAISTASSGLIAFTGLALTAKGLKRDLVGHQVLGLFVISAAMFGTHVPEASTGGVPVLVHKATFVGLLATLAIHALVELRNTSISAHSTMERAAADLTASNGLLKQQREERAQLIHDSRNALLVIQAGLQAVANDESEALIESLHSELSRIQAMIERNHSPIEPVDVLDTLTPMVRCYHSGGIPLQLRADGEDQQPIALASRTQLVEVMQNLIENAIRHAESDQPIEIAVRAADQFVELEVRDHGVGIDLRDRLRVAERVVSLSGIGAGRGLSICQRMITAMDGELEFVQPVRGVGSIFRIRLPTPAEEVDSAAIGIAV